MLNITVPAREWFDNKKGEFSSTKEQELQLEHSLVSISKWEAKWCKPFMSKTEKTLEETIDYVRCMTITQNVNPDIYKVLSAGNIKDVDAYIRAPMTATIIKDLEKKTNREIVTSELIYYWMVAFSIPFECQKWHLNRLITLIDVCNIKSKPPKKMGKKEILSRNAALNAARRKALKSNG
jgi:hypothetical protein